jgi:hypothetical protein
MHERNLKNTSNTNNTTIQIDQKYNPNTNNPYHEQKFKSNEIVWKTKVQIQHKQDKGTPIVDT